MLLRPVRRCVESGGAEELYQLNRTPVRFELKLYRPSTRSDEACP